MPPPNNPPQVDPWAGYEQYDLNTPEGRVSTLEDVGHSAVTGAQQGVAATVGLPGDLTALMDSGADWAVRQIMRASGQSDAQIDAWMQRFHAGRDFARGAGLPHGPTSGQVNNEIQNTFGAQWEPQTEAGQYARTIGSFLPEAALPGGWATRAARVVVPGAASEMAGQMTEGTPMEPWARMGGAMVGGVATEGASGLVNAPNRMAARDIAGATAADFAAAQRLRQEAAARGVDITISEALQQVTHGGTGTAGLQDWIERHPETQGFMARYFRNRPQQISTAINQVADMVAPPRPDPSMIGPQAQEAARGVINTERQAINARAQPHYDALPGEHMDPNDFDQLMLDRVFHQAHGQVRNSPTLNRGLEHLPDNSLAVINRVVQHLDESAENARPNSMRQGGSNIDAAQYGEVAGNARGAASQSSQGYQQPSNWDEARRIVREGNEQTLEPMRQGPLGRVADTDSTQQQLGALFPTAPLEGAGVETADAIRRMGAVDPDVTHDLARQQIMGGKGGANEQLQHLSGGENQGGGARWAASIAGNAQQREALLAGFRALPRNGPQLADDLEKVLEISQATGRRTSAGSATMPRSARDAASRQWIGDLRKAVGETLSGHRAQRLADFLTAHPDETEAVLRRLRGQDRGFRSPLAEAVLGRKPEEQQQ